MRGATRRVCRQSEWRPTKRSIFRNLAGPTAEGITKPNKKKASLMGLFKPDLYRAFFLGFGATALVMGAQFVPHLV
jgi:hypothetical protein